MMDKDKFRFPENDILTEKKKYFPGKPSNDFIIDPPMQQERLVNRVFT